MLRFSFCSLFSVSTNTPRTYLYWRRWKTFYFLQTSPCPLSMTAPSLLHIHTYCCTHDPVLFYSSFFFLSCTVVAIGQVLYPLLSRFALDAFPWRVRDLLTATRGSLCARQNMDVRLPRPNIEVGNVVPERIIPRRISCLRQTK